MKTTLFSWFFTCTVILFFSKIKAISFQCLDSEQSSLLKLKSSVTFNHTYGSKLQSWNKTSDCCLWKGVSCDRNGHVTSLDLCGDRISGTFLREIFQMPRLESIDLSNNEFLQGNLQEFSINSSIQHLELYRTKFSGRLPFSIGNLWNLSRLDLSNCQFDGPLPRSMENLARLEYLSLSNNKFTGPIPSFSLSKNLSIIDLSENSLIGEITRLHFEGLSKLNYLSFSRNSLNGSIPSSLFSLPSLFRADLSNNQFSSCEIANHSVLDYLDLSHNNIETLTSLDPSPDELNSTVPLNIFRGFGNLDHLDLSYNKLSFDVSDENSLDYFPQVSFLNLASCNLGAFPNLENQSHLFFLDLSNNRIPGEIPNWVWDFGGGTISFLNLSHNNLEAIQEPYSFPESLRVIDLNSNRLRGEIPSPHFAEYADFSSNKFSSIQTEAFDQAYSLGFFSLSNNSLTGVIPKSICNWNGVRVIQYGGKVLYTSHNNLSGEIPTCIMEGSDSLDVLNLHKNNLSGPIPDAFPNDCLLKIVNLNGNFIDGEIPKSLANCAQLRVLDLGHNNMTGEFPCFLKNISTLQVLILRDNKFYGSIECPDSNINWPVLQILDISENEFGGELRVKWLETLQVMKNDTLGPESNALGVTHYYPIILDRGASLLGQYYEYTVTTVTLKSQERELSKILATYTWIDLSCNNFGGSISEEFGHLLALKTLNLSNNALTGEIPSSLGDLRKLETLDLSHNNLNGTIPASLGGLNFLQFMILSFNQLTGRIPQGGQIQTFPEDFFIGNKGLCGTPLTKNCSELTNPSEEGFRESSKIDWNFLSAEIGFIVGFGVFIAPIMFSRRWRVSYFDRVDDIIVMIFPLAVARKWSQWTNTY